jgi:hypothetical protein
VQVAADSLTQKWSLAQIRESVAADVGAALRAGKIRDPKNLKYEGNLAGHPTVRGQLHRLMAVRDEVLVREPELVKQKFQRAQHFLVKLMELERDAETQHHTKHAGSVVRYVKTHRAGRSAQKKVSSVELTYQLDQHTYEELRAASLARRLPIRRLLDDALQSFLRQRRATPMKML